MENCVFCKISNKEIPANIVYEDYSVVAFLDISPVNSGHCLVIPKKHVENIFGSDLETFKKVSEVVHFIAPKIKSALQACGVNIIQNNNSCAGQVIFHMHTHIIPRFENDGLKHWPGKQTDEKQLKEMAEKIKSSISN